MLTEQSKVTCLKLQGCCYLHRQAAIHAPHLGGCAQPQNEAECEAIGLESLDQHLLQPEKKI
jgi:hypothetical protein